MSKSLKLFAILLIGVNEIDLRKENTNEFVFLIAYNRPAGGSMTPEDIDPCLCTHVIYAFSEMENNLLIPTEKHDLKDGSQPGRSEEFDFSCDF